ncbi:MULTISPECIES: hypothetical protein [Flavobacterium]|uniref:Lipoprotein n=1 Tax=Flavobacterium columnare TaxID=996 RepID=A0AA94F142_9FLAO|nr:MULTISPECIES: hypothetical protein [Flavobacterium]MCH4830941.1 hypothetical protein [Flavobacterium columnare]MCH4833118.1 hypothetical protein [Flavobacterium columnare]QYS90855.1 hypothetical protein JJC04_13130 [Flavobacterium covae]
MDNNFFKITLILLFQFFISCSSNSLQKKGSWEDKGFEDFLTKKNILFKKKENGYLYSEKSKSLYDDYFADFLKYETKTKLEKNPYLKVNKVYVHYRTSNSVEFSVYSDEETFCLSDYDLDMDGKILSLPDENGIVKVIKPIVVSYFGDFEITNNIIKTRRHSRSPFNEWYDYVEGKISNDTIYLSKKYWGKAKNNYKFKKYWLAKTRKTNIKEIYQPTLKAEKFKNSYGLTCFRVTGEFLVK